MESTPTPTRPTTREKPILATTSGPQGAPRPKDWPTHPSTPESYYADFLRARGVEILA